MREFSGFRAAPKSSDRALTRGTEQCRVDTKANVGRGSPGWPEHPGAWNVAPTTKRKRHRRSGDKVWGCSSQWPQEPGTGLRHARHCLPWVFFPLKRDAPRKGFLHLLHNPSSAQSPDPHGDGSSSPRAHTLGKLPCCMPPSSLSTQQDSGDLRTGFAGRILLPP